MKTNIEKMGDSLMSRMAGMNQAYQPLGIELGVIQSNLSLSPDNSPGPIPKGEYMICRSACQGSSGSSWTTTQPAGPGPHSHTVKLPDSLQSIKAGDRVLICWAGKTAVVVDVVLTS